MERFLDVQCLDVGGTPGTIRFEHIHDDGTKHYCRQDYSRGIVKCSVCGTEEKKEKCEIHYPNLGK